MKNELAGNKEEYSNKKQWPLLILCVFCLLYITLLSRGESSTRIFRVDVFATWRMWIGGNAARGRSILLNVALFVPLGYFLTQVLSGRKHRIPVTVLLGFAVSLLIETIQYHTGRGWFDVDDLINNTLGAAIGSGLFCTADRIMGKGKAGRVACDVLSVLLIAAGIVGCFRMAEMVSGSRPPEIVELDFEKDEIPRPVIPEDSFLEGAELKAYSAAFDTYVFQKGDSLIWLIGYEIEPTTEIIYHIHTNEINKLPENRIQYGFDNRGFRPGGENELESSGRYRVFEKRIPGEYRVNYIVVGFNPGDGVAWSQAFRVKQG